MEVQTLVKAKKITGMHQQVGLKKTLTNDFEKFSWRKEKVNTMPRNPKRRRVSFLPHCTFFKPAGIPLKQLQEEHILVEELEAIRLKDLEGLEQEACAERMGISRPTFQRVILSARQKLARALVEGKAIRIEGGNYSFSGITGPGECRHCRPFTEAEVETEVKADVNEGIPGRAGTAAGSRQHRCPYCGRPGAASR